MTNAPDPRPALMVSGSRLIGPESAPVVDAALRAGLVLLDEPLSEARRVPFVHGAAKGLDSLAAQAASRIGLAVEAHPAKWQEHDPGCPDWHAGQETCKRAGHRRNAEMIDRALSLGAPDRPSLLIAFPVGTKEEKKSPGTWGAIDAARAKGLPTLVQYGPGLWPADPVAETLVRAIARRMPAAAAHIGERGQVRTEWLADQLMPF